MATLINRKSVRTFILDYAKRSRHHPFTRVGSEAYDTVEAAVRKMCRELVDSQPSAGRTVK